MSGTILIVDDVATNRIVLKVKLKAACYETLQADNGRAALRAAREHIPDLILLDMRLPDIDGTDVCRMLKADPLTRNIPVIIITSSTDPAARMKALEAGADEFLAKTDDDLILSARLRSLLRARETSEELRLRDTTWKELGFSEASHGFERQSVVALIAARKETALAWRRQLEPHLADQFVVFGREEALSDGNGHGVSGSATPDLYMIDADLSQPGEGLRLLSELRSRPATRHSAICILVKHGDRETAVMALDLGASDLLTDGTEPREMALRLSTQIRRKHQADRLRASMRDGLRAAVTDPLTGLYNRRYAMPHLGQISERSAQTGKPFAVMVLDIDRFKSVNDTWGHAVGDAVLVDVAQRLRDHLRPVDLVARIGGEEFLVALPDAPLGLAQIAAERLCRVVQERPVLVAGGPMVNVTLSIGLAIGGGTGSSAHFGVQALIDRADHAMLEAKADGRNQVIISKNAA